MLKDQIRTSFESQVRREELIGRGLNILEDKEGKERRDVSSVFSGRGIGKVGLILGKELGGQEFNALRIMGKNLAIQKELRNSGEIYDHPEIKFDKIPMRDEIMRLIAHFIGRSVAYTRKYPFEDWKLSHDEIVNRPLLTSDSLTGFHALGYGSICYEKDIFESGELAACGQVQPLFSRWSPQTTEDADFANSTGQSIYSLFKVMSSKMGMTETELMMMVILCERVLTSGISDIPFVLNETNTMMTVVTCFMIVNKSISTDVPFSNAYWCHRFGIGLENLSISERFVLEKLNFQTQISPAEWEAAVVLKERIMKRWTVTPPSIPVSIPLQLQQGAATTDSASSGNASASESSKATVQNVDPSMPPANSEAKS
ncbi:uncharacterized protein MONOS_7208 [Monocercomonoides exilis]|uniref:uncharacterized protein n=1 Tax=Monocercomonoides exilis TaxID=2049356 RepID=UPI00355A627B|nr:hypothetical protein MONOS_7208 [Monocercomonoides exilis]|eukprot:MONOS_7208.1-p1 / transcript=MONOS_7208.1 / gene=MONOS_7208 / organism=Monocercomonoides_exilis_PA203 / gene_product=unspecified product / transcript_product=unspecified product / location=Mono_scaffold00241:19801-20916(+) / protein_length=372 / sequence_SO=supercontig / SO=protein_coding / is_pseudo=false